MNVSDLITPVRERALSVTRRWFLGAGSLGLGALAAEMMSGRTLRAAERPGGPSFGKAKHIIYLHMAGSPPQHDLFDPKPILKQYDRKPCPDSLLSVLQKERLAFIDLKRGRPKLLASPHRFIPRGDCGTEISELLPEFGKHADDICLVRSMTTDQFNHAPAQLVLYTGVPRFGNASLGSWVLYGLGSENENLPGFVVLISGGTDPSGGKSLWGSGFLPSVYQGVQGRAQGEPILFVTNPKGLPRSVRRASLDALKQLNQHELSAFGDPETATRISQFELAFRMQMEVPQVMDIRSETKSTLEAYGASPGKESFANNCLLARRLIENGVRVVQLFDYGWDMHGTAKGNDLVEGLPKKCRDIDRPLAALLTDLKQRGLLDETLLVWSGEFGRTPLNEERNGSKLLGRDHHPHCFSIWLAGAGVRGGQVIGSTDDLGYFVTENKMTVQDLQATMLHSLGLDPYKLIFPYQGLNQRLIGPTDDGKIRRDVLG